MVFPRFLKRERRCQGKALKIYSPAQGLPGDSPLRPSLSLVRILLLPDVRRRTVVFSNFLQRLGSKQMPAPTSVKRPENVEYDKMGPDELFNACVNTACSEAWAEFRRRYDPLIRGVVASVLTGSARDMVDDVVQEIYVRLTRKQCHSLFGFIARRVHADFGFIKRVAVTTALDFKKKNSISFCPLEDPSEQGKIEPDAERAVAMREIMEALFRVTARTLHRDRNRRIILLHYRVGLTASQISALPGIRLTDKGVEGVIKKIVELMRAHLQLKSKSVKNEDAGSGTLREPA